MRQSYMRAIKATLQMANKKTLGAAQDDFEEDLLGKSQEKVYDRDPHTGEVKIGEKTNLDD